MKHIKTFEGLFSSKFDNLFKEFESRILRHSCHVDARVSGWNSTSKGGIGIPIPGIFGNDKEITNIVFSTTEPNIGEIVYSKSGLVDDILKGRTPGTESYIKVNGTKTTIPDRKAKSEIERLCKKFSLRHNWESMC